MQALLLPTPGVQAAASIIAAFNRTGSAATVQPAQAQCSNRAIITRPPALTPLALQAVRHNTVNCSAGIFSSAPLTTGFPQYGSGGPFQAQVSARASSPPSLLPF